MWYRLLVKVCAALHIAKNFYSSSFFAMFATMKAISFDLWNTLIISNPVFKTLQAQLFSDFLDVELALLSPALFYLDKALDKKAEKKGAQASFQERISLLAQQLERTLPAGKINELYEAQESVFLANAPTLSEPNIGDLLDTLKDKGTRLLLISNTGFIAGKTLRMAMNELNIGQQWDTMRFSDEVGYSKPDKRMFAPFQQEPALQTTEILHVGDNLITDYYGARKNGFLSCLYTKNLPTFELKFDTIEHLWDLLKYTV